MEFYESNRNPYPMPRLPIYSKEGMVATSQPTAAQAGIHILKRGGNAIDAAIATAAALTVVEPTSNGIGGDAFALVWAKDKLHGLNSSGPSPKSISIEAITERGFKEMPVFGWEPVTVPGVPAAWAELAKKFGNLPLAETLQPAIELAKYGYAVPPTLSFLWQKAFSEFKEKFKESYFEPWFETFAPKGRAPLTGEVWGSADIAKTLESIAATNGESFYKGELAEKIDKFSKDNNGFISIEDLSAYSPEWVDPISVNYRGYDVWEIPPNGQGLSVLMALNILNQFPPVDRNCSKSIHRMIESIKLAMTDGNYYITESDLMDVKVTDLLSDKYAKERASLISDMALMPSIGKPMKGGTVYLATADGEGNMVSFIQSNYEGFGSGLVVPGTGIALQDRGNNFSLNPEDPNCLAPNKRTFHTIIPGFMTKNNKPIGPFGIMGGFNQPQGHVQAVINSVDSGLNAQATLDAPRVRWLSGKSILVEPHFPQYLIHELLSMGHDVKISLDSTMFGRGQIIWRNPDSGTLIGGTESRTDGTIAVL